MIVVFEPVGAVKCQKMTDNSLWLAMVVMIVGTNGVFILVAWKAWPRPDRDRYLLLI